MSNPYDQNPYGGGGGVPQPHPKGTQILVLGILSIVLACGVIGLILGIVTMVQSKPVLAEIDANPAAYNNRQQVNIGRILGIVGLILGALSIVYWIIMIVIGIGSAMVGS
ncbi:CCC motif membrane protein [Microlunatus speluncae]|uniref:CCC motif membrane protein n=1 Tax=Microlunatus speluncae TaxID=2594267 RepID=UPI0012664A23|nr:CCC motif membrane protein [Microlunatus speluncae]